MIGVIVTADAGDNNFDTNPIDFRGTVTSQGVEALPDTPEFHELRELSGTMMLAPGFGVSFSGNFGALNGAIVAETFAMTGDAGGTIYGPIISYGDAEIELGGSSAVRIDRSRYGTELPGLLHPVRLMPEAGTYKEL